MLKKLIFILVLAIKPLFSIPADYFKKAENKEGAYQIKNIDFIYLINLDQRPEKYEHCIQELAPYSITPYRFSAVNGWELDVKDLNQLGIKYAPWMRKNLMGTCYLPEYGENFHHEVINVVGRNYFCHCLSRGAIGILLSHLSILQDAYNSGYETIWVMEDDIQVLQNPHILSNFIEELDQLVGKKNWDILFTDRDTKNQAGHYVSCSAYALKPHFDPVNPNRFSECKNIGFNFRKIGARYGAYSMIIRRSGMEKILNFLKDGLFLPYDMEYTLPDDIQLYTVQQDVVSTQSNAFSDNGAPNYKQKLLH